MNELMPGGQRKLTAARSVLECASPLALSTHGCGPGMQDSESAHTVESGGGPPHSRTFPVSLRLAPIACITFILALAGFAPSAFAERYLTVAEAQKICFPTADRFEEQTIRFTAEERKAIEKRTGARVLNRGNRVVIASQGTNRIGVLVIDHVLGKNEIIDYAVAISPDGKVRQVEVLEYRESHGYEIRSPRWRDQFKGKTADSKLRLNDDISNISGATISCRQVTEGVKRVLATFEVVLRARLDVAGMPNDKP